MKSVEKKWKDRGMVDERLFKVHSTQKEGHPQLRGKEQRLEVSFPAGQEAAFPSDGHCAFCWGE